MSTTAPAKATAQSIIVLRFPNLSFDILSKPGTGGTRRRTKTRTTIRAMVNDRAIALEFYHHSPRMWGFRKLTVGKFDRWQVSGIAVFPGVIGQSARQERSRGHSSCIDTALCYSDSPTFFRIDFNRRSRRSTDYPEDARQAHPLSGLPTILAVASTSCRAGGSAPSQLRKFWHNLARVRELLVGV